ncbi:hypothetical protein DUI87_10405 [Hirundo rustica rustica]|uniref:Protein LTV1 homolog n=1 Tax=Hirundo rustica rustica TaxID=333673 RepID=A0A3M0KPD6_HIRRU|nr:hypothetical protein DUI87_10405 [Hirundo rustica rustica]
MGHEEQRREEQRKYGVFFDDDYDYLQHLKEPLVPLSLSHLCVDSKAELSSQAPSIKLPSSVFATEFEEDVGLLNKAAPVSGPRLDFDPDIVAALDDDFDFDNPENILEDDFVLQANKPQKRGPDAEDEDEWEDMEDDSDEKDSCSTDTDSEGPLSDEVNGRTKEFLFMQEETRSRFTDYSMSSSVIRRNEQLTLLDDRFEKFYEQFDEDEIGALDNVELEGYISTDNTRLQEVLDDYYKEKAKNCVKLDGLEPDEDLDCPANEESEEEKEEIVTVVIEEPKEKWDCESILSTYSNLYNHPTLIKEPSKPKPIKISQKTGIPLHVLPQKGLTAKQVERMQMINGSDLPKASTQPRSKAESKEDRKARKQAIKEERKERRMEKKANKLAFKQEKTRQEKELLNLKQNMQDHAVSEVPISGHAKPCQSSKEPFQPLFKVVVVLLLKRMAQVVSNLHLSEMYTTAEHEFLAGNEAKNDSLELASCGEDCNGELPVHSAIISSTHLLDFTSYSKTAASGVIHITWDYVNSIVTPVVITQGLADHPQGFSDTINIFKV